MARILSRSLTIEKCFIDLWACFRLQLSGYRTGCVEYKEMHATCMALCALRDYLKSVCVVNKDVLKLLRREPMVFERDAVQQKIAEQNFFELPFNVY